jgi:peptide chain release factor 1
MNPDEKVELKINPNDITKQYTCSRGKGGQNVNRIQSCVVLTHIPTGIMVRSEETRNQGKNEELAYKRLSEKLKVIEEEKFLDQVKTRRNDQIGNGDRGTRKRTYRLKEDVVIDHETGKNCRWKDILKGRIELLK